MNMWIYLTLEIGSDVTGNQPLSHCIYERNVTSNLNPMLDKANVYEATHETNWYKAGTIIDVLAVGIADMQAHPDEYKKLNPPNGWGSYEYALNFLISLHQACVDYPNAIISIGK
jgi:hypothetical protein